MTAENMEFAIKYATVLRDLDDAKKRADAAELEAAKLKARLSSIEHRISCPHCHRKIYGMHGDTCHCGKPLDALHFMRE